MIKSKIKICHIVSADIALKFLLLPQLKFLKEEGYDVYAVCSNGKWIESVAREGIKIKTITLKRKISPISDLIAFLKLFFYFKREKFQIVHTHTPKPGLLGQLAAKVAGVPIIINTIHGFYFHENTPFLQRKFFIFIERIATSCSDLILSQNKEDIKTAIKEKICSSQKIKFLGNGISLQKFNSERFSKDFIDKKKKELNIKSNLKVIGMVGRLVREKGYLELFEGFKNLIKKFPNTILLILGPMEPEKNDAINPDIVKNYGIEKNIIFLGLREDIDEIYPLMDIFVLPSWREGFPRSVIEALAMGRAVIATNIRGCREAVDDGVTGILVPPKNPEKLAEAIVFLLKNPEKAKEIGEAGRKRAEKEFDEKQIFDIIKREYQVLREKKLR